MKSPLLIQGMHGMGDCLHERAVVKHYLAQGREIWLETSWPAIFHDLVGPDLHLIRRPVNLHAQTKNAAREADKFYPRPAPAGCEAIRVMYHGNDVMRTDSKTVLESMCRATNTPYPADYRLPVPEAWVSKARSHLGGYDGSKPLLVYRPLVARPEWRGSMARNANELCYAHLVGFLRQHFFVVSVADLVPGVEWMVGYELKADVTLHKGELDFEALAGMFSIADLVVTSSGFAAILAPAVGTRCINIVGGYEDARAHDSGKLFAPFLSIEPAVPCRCWSSACTKPCMKDIDMLAAVDHIAKFVKAELDIEILPRKGLISEMFHTERRAQDAPTTIPPPPASPFRRQPHPNSPAYRQYIAMLQQGNGLKA